MADIIKILVIMVFAYIIIKYQILPRIAAKKLQLQARAAQEQASGQAQGLFSGTPADPAALQAGVYPASVPPPPGMHVSCFDMRIIDLSTVGKGDGDTFDRRITYEANEMLLKASVAGCRGTVPHLGVLPFLDDALMLYIVYTV